LLYNFSGGSRHEITAFEAKVRFLQSVSYDVLMTVVTFPSPGFVVNSQAITDD